VVLTHSGTTCDSCCGVDLQRVALAVAESKSVHGEPLPLRNRENGSRIEPAAQENDRGGWGAMFDGSRF